MDNSMGVGNVGGNPSESEVHTAFDRVTQSAPQTSLADGLAHAFQSDQTPPFEQMVANLFAHSNPEQKAGLLNQLMNALGPAGVSQALGASGTGTPGGLASGPVTPQQAVQVTPPVVQSLAQKAAAKDPTIVQRAAGFYAEHPTLVKTVGVAALALLVSRMTSMKR